MATCATRPWSTACSKGVDVLIHMAGTSVERPLPEIIENNLVGLHAVYEGARRHKVKRIVFASSNHAIGMHPVEDKLGLDCDVPARLLLWPQQDVGRGHGADVLGQARDRGHQRPDRQRPAAPDRARHLSTWLGHEDLLQLTMRCIEAPDIGYLVVWGVSDNTRSYWDNAGAERLGYRPTQNSEDYAAEVLSQPNPLDATAQRYQGGGFVTQDFTPVRSEARADEPSFPPRRARS